MFFVMHHPNTGYNNIGKYKYVHEYLQSLIAYAIVGLQLMAAYSMSSSSRSHLCLLEVVIYRKREVSVCKNKISFKWSLPFMTFFSFLIIRFLNSQISLNSWKQTWLICWWNITFYKSLRIILFYYFIILPQWQHFSS